MIAAIVVSVVMIQRLSELLLARKNYARAMRLGGSEVGAAHYLLFVILHSSWLASLLLESVFFAPPIPPWWPFFLAAVFAAQLLRYWAIATLGYRWNTRIVVFPQADPLRTGPYRYLKHPNYVAVALEIFFIPALLGAWYSAIVFSILNAALLLFIRIPMEERALRDAGRGAGAEHRPSPAAADDLASSETPSMLRRPGRIRNETDEGHR